MSIARHHAEWLSLLDVSGPFVSVPVLVKAFPQGIDAFDDGHPRELRAAYAQWRADPAVGLTPWVRFVLTRTLAWKPELLDEGPAIAQALQARMHLHGETLRPDLVLRGSDGVAQVLVAVHRPIQDLEKPLPEAPWPASPATRMMELLHATGVRLGLVTNGERWMLVDAPLGQTTGFASWYAALWSEEPLTLRAFRSLLGLRRIMGVDPENTLAALLTKSAESAHEITDQLGFQVRRAVEVLVQAIDRIDRDRDRKLLQGISEKVLYEAAVTVMMRLVFLLYAEESGLILPDHPVYQSHYAVGTLREALREVADRAGEEVLERKHGAWARLVATARMIHAGASHDGLTLPAYGGALFDPDRFPFLEGRSPGTRWKDTPADPLPIHDRAVLHLLEALQLLRTKGAGGVEVRRLSFRALTVEQIGHVYEGLLDHTAVRAQGPVLGLAGTRTQEPEIPITELERRIRDNGVDGLVAWLKEETGKSDKALRKALEYKIPRGDGRPLAACEQKVDLYQRVVPFAGLVREDTLGMPVVIPEGSVYVTQGSDRRATGAHYTPPSLTEPVVRYTLEPLVYEGPAEGWPEERWRLRTAREILALRVCDLAMGSGAFLVQACRYLAARLVEAWRVAERERPGAVVVTPEGELAEGDPAERVVPRGEAERLVVARRLVADRCLFGVDVNPMAVEMAKLSLWLETFQRERPFTFLDHALRCGDSLLGVTNPEQIEWFHLDPARGREIHRLGLFDYASACAPALADALAKRRRLESFPVDTIAQAEEKARLLAEADTALGDVRLIADLLVGVALSTAGRSQKEFEARLEQLDLLLKTAFDVKVERSRREGTIRELQGVARRMLDAGKPEGVASRRPFHWALEFPEVFGEGRKGFDAIVGNPPFMGGQKITGEFGTDYRDALVQHIAEGRRGSADLVAYFFLRANVILRAEGMAGLIATNTIAQGDSREVGLDAIVSAGATIVRAVASEPWPGTANLEMSRVWWRRSGWLGKKYLGQNSVGTIWGSLSDVGSTAGSPERLAANQGLSFQGTIVLGMGFVLSHEEARDLIALDERNGRVVMPYMTGENLNSRFDQSSARSIINFRDWSESEAAQFGACYAIVLERVKPERQRQNADGTYVQRKPLPERWWQYAEKRPGLYSAIESLDYVWGIALTSKTMSPTRIKNDRVFDQTVVVFAVDDFGFGAVTMSSVHRHWALAYGAALRTDARYTPTDCFETFPFPESLDELDAIGERYHAFRAEIMKSRREGLTATYNRFHDPKEKGEDIVELRRLHVGMDRAVADAYGWQDLELGHGFHTTKQGVRYTIAEAARREVLARLLKLNHARYAAEVAAGLHDKGKKKGAAPKGKGSAGKGGQGDGPLFG